MLKEKEMSVKGLFALRERLSVIPSLKVDILQQVAGDLQPDVSICVEGIGSSQKIFIEYKTLGTPKSVHEAVNAPLRLLQDDPAAYGVVIAPYISPASASICKQAGIGYVDLSGNCFIAFQQVFLKMSSNSDIPVPEPSVYLGTGVSLLCGVLSAQVLPETLSPDDGFQIQGFCKEAENLACKIDLTTAFGV